MNDHPHADPNQNEDILGINSRAKSNSGKPHEVSIKDLASHHLTGEDRTRIEAACSPSEKKPRAQVVS